MSRAGGELAAIAAGDVRALNAVDWETVKALAADLLDARRERDELARKVAAVEAVMADAVRKTEPQGGGLVAVLRLRMAMEGRLPWNPEEPTDD